MNRVKTSLLLMGLLGLIFLCGSVPAADDVNLVAHWAFDEGSGNVAHDSAGSNNGTIYGAAWTNGMLGGALDFDGINDYVQVPDNVSLTPSNTITFAFWVNSRGGQIARLNKYAYCPSQGSSPGNSRAYVFGPGSTGHIEMEIFSSVSTYDASYSLGSIAFNEWHHVAGTFDHGSVAFYIDGQHDSDDVMTVTSIMNDAQPLTIGGHWDYCANSFVPTCNGILDDVRIYNRALSAQEVMQIPGVVPTPPASGLVAHWAFDEGSGNVAHDSAGSNNGTIYGAAWTNGMLGGALDFDGINDRVDVPDSPSLRFRQTDSFTMSCWAMPLGDGRLMCKMRKSGTGVFGYETIYQSSIAAFEFAVESSWVGFTPVRTPNGSAPHGEWHLFTAVYSNRNMTVYLNGRPAGAGVFPYNAGNTTPDKNLSIGARSYDSKMLDYFEGGIDDVRIYNRSLSAEQVASLYFAIPVCVDIKPGSCKNPLNVATRGILTAAILGRADFDVNQIDIATIRLAGVAAVRSSMEDVSGPVYDANTFDCNATGGDGYPDLVLKFKTQEIVEELLSAGEDQLAAGQEWELMLTGSLKDGTPIEGADRVIIVGKVPSTLKAKKADINADGIVDARDFALLGGNWLEPADIK